MTAEQTLGHAPVDAVAGLPAAADAIARLAAKPNRVSTPWRILLVLVVLAAGSAALSAARAGKVGPPAMAFV